jgi:hypothetical protein
VRRVGWIEEPMMLNLAKHAVAIVVVAAASAPVAAHAEVPSFSYTHLVVTHNVQADVDPPAHPR